MNAGGTFGRNKSIRILIAKLRRVLHRLGVELKGEFKSDHFGSVVNQVQMHRRVLSLYRQGFRMFFMEPFALSTAFDAWQLVLATDFSTNAADVHMMVERLKEATESLEEDLIDLRNKHLSMPGTAIAIDDMGHKE